MRLLQQFQHLCKRQNQINSLIYGNRSFNTNSCVKMQASFDDKPMWLKKLKLKQARMQKDDGLPVFLKMGFRDKLLYNITLYGFFIGMLWVFKVFRDCDKPYKTH